jgi:hypothetical protein
MFENGPVRENDGLLQAGRPGRVLEQAGGVGIRGRVLHDFVFPRGGVFQPVERIQDVLDGAVLARHQRLDGLRELMLRQNVVEPGSARHATEPLPELVGMKAAVGIGEDGRQGPQARDRQVGRVKVPVVADHQGAHVASPDASLSKLAGNGRRSPHELAPGPVVRLFTGLEVDDRVSVGRHGRVPAPVVPDGGGRLDFKRSMAHVVDLGVRRRPECTTTGPQFVAQFHVVVDLIDGRP